ncbi:MAG: hypothetical protein K1X75_09250 [Leptospirales bacterium]|nr:hypothetical protein [Leptospirales bacterium]
MQNRKLLLAIGGALAVVLLVVLFFMIRNADRSESEDGRMMGERTAPDGSGGSADEALGIEANDPQERLDRYVRWAKYPPFTRPLSQGQVDLLDPYNAERPAVNVVLRPARNCSQGADGIPNCEEQAQFSDIQCSFSPERSISVGRNDFHLFLSCQNQKGEKLPIDSLQTQVFRTLHNKTYPSLPVVSAADDGANGDEKAGDRIYTITVRPTLQDWGDMYVEAKMRVGGQDHAQRAAWFSTPQPGAEFQQGIRDQVRNGDLVFTIPVRVSKPGYYEVEANLQESGGEGRLLASAYWEGELSAGTQNVELVFFGKVLRDQDAQGPFVLRELRGKRNNSPVTPAQIRQSRIDGRSISGEHREPIWEYLLPWPGPTTTQSYSADQFHNREWDSEEKREHIRLLEEHLQDG